MRLSLVLAALLLSVPSAQAQEADSTYAAMVAQLRAGDTDLDYTALRLTYAETEAYSPYDIEPKKRVGRMFTALFEEEDAALALAIADSALDAVYVDIDAHMVASIAHRRLENEAAADFHLAIADGLVGSIIDSGDGRDPDSPLVVINTTEEYALLRVSGLGSQGQSLTTCGGSPCDRLTVTVPDSDETFDLFFDVSRPMAWMNREFGGD